MKRAKLTGLLSAGILVAGISVAILAGIARADQPTPVVIDPDKMCSQASCQQITEPDVALRRVAGAITAISGGTLPSRIDVNEETAAQVDQVFGEPTQLAADRQVWYVHIYNPVILSSQTGAMLPPGVQSISKVHGAAWVIDARTGIVVAFAAFD